ncbi:MAG: vitamin B12 dependent-methionine synthase activation domain-containing protein [[Clostridium] aminophilum]|uniref:vitamin B12 dependent-methionine synthase activation domain-containing protein n=1 Tax=[Clostridium] aminophilum TaxID=1526 RepID=UPI0026EB442A|nr:vitamin B12 dependent-methionine synthase activation domain-containing protein [[Clostridium] aminophilum]MDD6196810.1 vitamin B12 dependent-methionine synthase activation domain-containing protein [[Clostridium] aminophilum]
MIDINLHEVYRFLGDRTIRPGDELDERIRRCIGKMQQSAAPRSIHRRFPVRTKSPDLVFIADLTIRSKNLYKNLKGCDEVILFAATVGVGIDRLIRRSEVTSILDAAIYQAAGAAMIEAYADAEVRNLADEAQKTGYTFRPRYSPGYGDLPLSLQRDFSRLLDMEKWCGITLTDTLLMVPSKSITAFIGCVKNSDRINRETGVSGTGSNPDDSEYLADIVNPLELETSCKKPETDSHQSFRSPGRDAEQPEQTSDMTGIYSESDSCLTCSHTPDCLYRKQPGENTP